MKNQETNTTNTINEIKYKQECAYQSYYPYDIKPPQLQAPNPPVKKIEKNI